MSIKSKEIDVNNKSSLTSQLLQSFSPIHDGVEDFIDVEVNYEVDVNKSNLFDISKITVAGADGIERSVYFPIRKPGSFNHYKELFDSIPIDIKDINHIATPDDYNKFIDIDKKFGYTVHNGLHVIQQGTTSASGPTALAMVLMDNNIDITHLKSQIIGSQADIFINNLYKLAKSKCENVTYFDNSNCHNVLDMLRNNLSPIGPNSAAIASYGSHTHFIVIDRINNNTVTIRDPFQGTLSEIGITSFETSQLGSGIVLFPKN